MSISHYLQGVWNFPNWQFWSCREDSHDALSSEHEGQLGGVCTTTSPAETSGWAWVILGRYYWGFCYKWPHKWTLWRQSWAFRCLGRLISKSIIKLKNQQWFIVGLRSSCKTKNEPKTKKQPALTLNLLLLQLPFLPELLSETILLLLNTGSRYHHDLSILRSVHNTCFTFWGNSWQSLTKFNWIWFDLQHFRFGVKGKPL